MSCKRGDGGKFDGASYQLPTSLLALSSIQTWGMQMRILHLDDRKVIRRFGKRPDLGCIIGGASPTKRVTVGVRWSLPRKKYEPDDNVLVRCTVSLTCIGKGRWKAQCQESHREYVEWWLVSHCGHGNVSYNF